MYGVEFYKDKNGNSAIEDYLSGLIAKNDKSSRIKFNKIYEYINYLGEAGKQIGEPYVKHLDGEIWELRPIRDRILFAAWYGESFVLLHHFMKKTRKTPQREIERAKRNLADYRERSGNNEKK